MFSKARAVTLFGNQTKLAKAVGRHKNTVYAWKDPLSEMQESAIFGAAVRLFGKELAVLWLYGDRS